MWDRRSLGLLSWSVGLLHSQFVRGAQAVIDGMTITTPPNPIATASYNILPRANSAPSQCSFGQCGGLCLSQGAFCCNPGGSMFPPNWICDNGACITSVRGDAGIVDCYDPDNPSGTTQSCIDFKPTATCASTDRCYTCSSTEAYCHWQTWVASNSPTLRWFSCTKDNVTDATFIAASITILSNITQTTITSSTSTSSPSSSLSHTDIPTSTTTTTTTTATAAASSSTVTLSTGAIAGIAVGGGVLLIACIALACYAFRKRRPSPGGIRGSISAPQPTAELASPTQSHVSTPFTQMDEQMRWQMMEDRYKTLVPVELPEDSHVGQAR